MTSRFRAGTAALAVVGIALGTAGSAAAAPGRATLRDSAAPAAARTPQVGSVAASTPIRFEVDLKLPDAAAAAAFGRAVSTPGSAQYGHYLTAAQWEARFSPSSRSVAQVRAFLKAQGFTVRSVSADRLAVSASGTAAEVQRAFSTTLALHRVGGHVLRLAGRDLSVPAALSGVIGGVTGVSQNLAHPDNTTGAAEPRTATGPESTTGTIPAPSGFRTPQPCSSSYGSSIDSTLPPYGGGYPTNPPWVVCGYTGPQLRSGYGLTGSADGTGVTVAVLDAYASPWLLSDAQEFAARHDPSYPLATSQFSELLAKNYTNQNICGASDWFGEQNLDVEAVHDAAPGAHILYAGAASCETPDLNASLRAIVDGHLASIISNSYGDNAGDLLDSASDRQSTDAILQMAQGTGISVLFSSGDNGDEFTTVGQVAADYPASSPYATAVGGTSLEIGSSGQRLGEYGWSTARSFLCNSTEIARGACTSAQQNQWLPIDLALDGGSGGGTSVVYPQPAWQAGVVPSSLSQWGGQTSPMRVVPDISMLGDPGTGMLEGETQTFPDGVYYDEYRIGGTSVASPLFAGVLARVDSAAGRSVGFVNPLLYSLARNANAIYDIGPAGKQIESRVDYANYVDASAGYLDSTRIIDYEGPEQYCPPKGNNGCSSRQVALHAVRGYDNMTGLGSPGSGFVAALAAAASK